jgi:hypothetical protein
MEKKNHAIVYLSEFFSTHQTLLIWRVIVDLRVGHSIYEVTFHPRNARVVLFVVSGGDASKYQPGGASMGPISQEWPSSGLLGI